MAIKPLKEKWERSIQSAREKGEKEIGASSTITKVGSSWYSTELMIAVACFLGSILVPKCLLLWSILST